MHLSDSFGTHVKKSRPLHFHFATAQAHSAHLSRLDGAARGQCARTPDVAQRAAQAVFAGSETTFENRGTAQSWGPSREFVSDPVQTDAEADCPPASLTWQVDGCAIDRAFVHSTSIGLKRPTSQR